MTDLRAAIDTLKAALDKTPRDSTTRPVHTALLDVLTMLADSVEPRFIITTTTPVDLAVEPGVDITYTVAPKHKGWPKGKPRKPQPEAVSG